MPVFFHEKKDAQRNGHADITEIKQIKQIKNKKTFDKYYNYSAEVVLKRVLKYAWKSKTLIILSLLFLVGYTVLWLFYKMILERTTGITVRFKTFYFHTQGARLYVIK
mgnify:CR=1 FL=1